MLRLFLKIIKAIKVIKVIICSPRERYFPSHEGEAAQKDTIVEARTA